MIKFILCLLIIHNNVAADDDDYMFMREKLIKTDAKRLVGEDLILNEAEEKVSTFLIQKKQEELDAEAKNGISLQEINFLFARDQIEESEIYKIIQLMPKGIDIFLLLIILPCLQCITQPTTLPNYNVIIA